MSRLTVVTQIGRWLKRAKPTLRERRVKLLVHPSVSLSLAENGNEKLESLRTEYKIKIDLTEDPFLHPEEYRMYSVKRDIDITDEFKM